jgi:hypothetical protein
VYGGVDYKRVVYQGRDQDSLLYPTAVNALVGGRFYAARSLFNHA